VFASGSLNVPACVCATRLATVVVHVDDPRFGCDRLDDLVGVARGRDAGADVKELPDPRLPGEVADDPAEERAVRVGAEG
jgi:hypothetical protein